MSLSKVQRTLEIGKLGPTVQQMGVRGEGGVRLIGEVCRGELVVCVCVKRAKRVRKLLQVEGGKCLGIIPSALQHASYFSPVANVPTSNNVDRRA